MLAALAAEGPDNKEHLAAADGVAPALVDLIKSALPRPFPCLGNVVALLIA